MLLRHYLEQGASESALGSSGPAGTQFTDGFEPAIAIGISIARAARGAAP